MSLHRLLGGLTRIAGVRGALLVSRTDGLVVAEALMDDVNGSAIAALAASLAGRMKGVTDALGQPEPVLLQLQATDGALVAALGRNDLLVVAVAAPEVNAAELRLELLGVAEGAA